MFSRLLVLTISNLVWLSALGQEPPPAPVKVSRASTQNMSSVVQAPGTVVSRNDARISAEIAGRLNWVAEVGEEIEQGEVIARIDDRAWQLQLEDNEASIKRLEADLRYINQQADRLRKLAQENNAARNELDEQLARRDMGEQDLIRARVAREQTLYQIERAQVRAAFTGKIVERYRQVGEYTSVGEEIVRLVDTHNIEVRAQAPMAAAPYLFEDLPVQVSNGGRQHASRIRTVIPVGDERSRLMEVRVTLTEGAWPIGAAVRVALPSSDPMQVVAVPRDALILRQDATYLLKVTATGTVEQVPVQTGVGNGEMIEVRGNVGDGDQIVIRGGERLRSGQAITITDDA